MRTPRPEPPLATRRATTIIGLSRELPRPRQTEPMVDHDPTFDDEAAARWLRSLDGWDEAVITGVQPLDGYSSINRRLDLDGAPEPRVVLKVQPSSGIFEPYDVLREATVLRRLAGSAVPVPRVLAEEPDPTVLGAPFFAMSWIDAPHMGVADDGDAYP
ncbi:hypothetical protein B7486_57815, partial [cyanobacterium TDX16]